MRDLRVRWALEEAGLPYEERLISLEQCPEEAASGRQAFAQVPSFQEGDLTLFESGAIVHYIGEKSPALLPVDPGARAKAVTWMFAALNSVEPFQMNLGEIDFFAKGEEWAKLRRPAVVEALRGRLGHLSYALGNKDYLEGSFTAGDLLMISVLRLLREPKLLAEYPNLLAYVDRGEARPAFRKALEAQMSVFARNAPAS